MSSFQENVSADKTSIGFEYQFYYFIYKILGLKKGAHTCIYIFPHTSCMKVLYKVKRKQLF
ncbi:hypothetical protein Q604_UNBC15637G0001, partial [human gut metagenome]